MKDGAPHPLLGASMEWSNEAGSYIDSNHRRVAQIVNDYDSRLFLAWIPPDRREPGNPYVYALVHQPPGQPEYVAKTFRADEIDERVLAWIFRADNNRFDTLTELDALEAARKLAQAKAWEDAREQMKEFAKTVMGSPLHTFKHDGKVFT